jgi:hypothetical protein
VNCARGQSDTGCLGSADGGARPAARLAARSPSRIEAVSDPADPDCELNDQSGFFPGPAPSTRARHSSSGSTRRPDRPQYPGCPGALPLAAGSGADRRSRTGSGVKFGKQGRRLRCCEPQLIGAQHYQLPICSRPRQRPVGPAGPAPGAGPAADVPKKIRHRGCAPPRHRSAGSRRKRAVGRRRRAWVAKSLMSAHTSPPTRTVPARTAADDPRTSPLGALRGTVVLRHILRRFHPHRHLRVTPRPAVRRSVPGTNETCTGQRDSNGCSRA